MFQDLGRFGLWPSPLLGEHKGEAEAPPLAGNRDLPVGDDANVAKQLADDQGVLAADLDEVKR
jgi:hypothetical protein